MIIFFDDFGNFIDTDDHPALAGIDHYLLEDHPADDWPTELELKALEMTDGF